ncbi:anti-sigma factor [Thalassorhabdomicrobium marinisediminis]|nr:anti-sigma factor [Thalassorhabdomicrobium marinisediminis]
MTDADLPYQDGPDGDEMLAAELSLGLLSGEEQTQAERRARTDLAFADRVEAWDKRFASLTEGIAPVTPPAGLFQQIEARAYGSGPRRLWRQLGLLHAVFGALAAALVLLVALDFGVLEDQPGPTATMTAQLAAEDRSLVVAAAYVDEGGRLFVERQIGERPPGRDLELWIIVGEAAPISLGVLPQDRRIAEFTVPADLRATLGDAVLAITDEPIGGAPDGTATGSVLAAGPVSRI